MAGVVKVKAPAPESRPALALAIALGIDMLLLPVMFIIPPYGVVVVLTIVPYVGGRIGGRRALRRPAVRASAVAAAIEVTVLATIMLSLLGKVPGADLELLEPIGLTLLVSAYLLGILFGALGGAHGARPESKTR
jgi:hypothetical protein